MGMQVTRRTVLGSSAILLFSMLLSSCSSSGDSNGSEADSGHKITVEGVSVNDDYSGYETIITATNTNYSRWTEVVVVKYTVGDEQREATLPIDLYTDGTESWVLKTETGDLTSFEIISEDASVEYLNGDVLDMWAAAHDEMLAEEAKYVTFGKYAQTDTTANDDPIQWKVLAEGDGRCLLVSRYVLDFQDYRELEKAESSDWYLSTLRTWLNSTFLNSAFTQEEQSQIIATTISSENGTSSDQVIILAPEQAWSLFPDDASRRARPTQYCESLQQFHVSDDGYIGWWLLDTEDSLYKPLVSPAGADENHPRTNESEGVRPAIWVNAGAIGR